MEIKEAIAVNGDIGTISCIFERPDRRNAIKLGIEALKWIEELRRVDWSADYDLLPGETEE